MNQAPAKDHLTRFRARADRLLVAVLAVHFAVCLGFGIYAGNWGIALLVGGPAVLVPGLLSQVAPGALVTRLATGFATMIFSALLIHQAQGQIEAHFGIFVLLAFLLLYCDWRPLVAAAGLIAVHHLSFAWLQAGGAAVYVFPQPDGVTRVVVHALYVVIETGVLIAMSRMLLGLIEDGMQVSGFAASVGEGRLDFRFPDAQLRRSPVLRGIADMQATLVTALGEVKRISDALSEVAHRVRRSASEIATRADEQSDSSGAVASSIEELTAAIAQIAGNAEDAHRLSDEASRNAHGGNTEVERAVTEMTGIAQAISTASHDVETLGQQSEKAAEVVGIIREIADQTNLLALNAAIEAARAGELGRGFAVVADEVRKLSERTSTATSEIAQMMAEMRIARESALQAISNAVAKVERGASQTAKAGETYRTITGGSQQVGQVVAMISTAIAEQNTATQDISHHVEVLTRLAEGTAANTHEITTQAEDLERSARSLRDAMGHFRLA